MHHAKTIPLGSTPALCHLAAIWQCYCEHVIIYSDTMNYYELLWYTTDYVIVALELILCGAVLSGNNFKRSKPIHRLLFDLLGMPWYYSLYLMFLIFSTSFGSFLEWWKHVETSIRQAPASNKEWVWSCRAFGIHWKYTSPVWPVPRIPAAFHELHLRRVSNIYLLIFRF